VGNRAKRDLAVARSIARMRAEDAKRAREPNPTPRCACGHSYADGTLWAAADRLGRPIYYCRACLPAGAP